jgi:hypothetical protein
MGAVRQMVSKRWRPSLALAAPAPALGPVMQLTVPVPPIFQGGDPVGVTVDPLWEPHIAGPVAESPNIVMVWA